MVILHFKKDKDIVIIFILLAIFCSGFSYVGWNSTLGGQISQIVLLLLWVYVVVNIRKSNYEKSPLSPFILCFMLLPLLSLIPAEIVHDQSIASSFYSTKKNLLYIIFFAFIIRNVEEKDMLKLMCVLGVCWCVIEIVQQFSYPLVLFSSIGTETEEVTVRNGIYRYNVFGREFGLIMLFYCFTQYLTKRKLIYLAGVVLGLIGVYLLATRQIMAVSALCLLYGMFSIKKLKLTSFIGICLVGFIIYANRDTLFGDFVEMTSNDLSDDGYIRLIAYEHYGISYNDGNLLQILLGNGDPNRVVGSRYSAEILSLEKNYGLYRSDIGIVGMYSCYGLIYVISIIAFFVFCLKKRKCIDVYLQMFIVYMIVTSVMLWHFGYTMSRIATMCCVFYILDRCISRNNVKERVSK